MLGRWNDMWGKAIAIGLLVLGSAFSFYKAGRYAAGGVDIAKGNSAAAVSALGAFINIIIAALLYLDV